ncbi:hypothetical protein I302_100045 [Kwoniella bestiolae CBS 10118]|uniref:tRNA (Uracil-5-)-methyltransferase n=1 Tax=Kwoniella bestiolae CBS 10118 TaxID=1296100 RepID=A0A1B9G3Y7_9TREE|nr:tRNA (uracil-5-)-methyltransferase [Kwoniella bestiolae CBS 10118]OCF25744.1 tRNA (uracil-5-)-methyltransferase [Kwoniella bestiolae CBS 10118]
MTTTPPSPSTSSPPAKRLKSSGSIPDVIKTNEFTAINEAPIKSEFLPDTNGHTVIIPKEASASGSSSKPQQTQKKKNRKIKRTLPEKYSSADVTFHDVRDFIGADLVDEVIGRKDGSEWEVPEGLELFKEVELDVGAFTVSGESISLLPNSSDKPWTIITPFAHPGDKIRAKIYKHDRLTSYADLVEILEHSEEYRGGEGDRRKYPEGGCRYFGECGGCQLQPVPYPLQLLHKKRTVQLAYQRFSDLPSTALPTIQPTIGSPKEWAYRTKITPHFDAPPKWFQKQMKEKKVSEEGEMNASTTNPTDPTEERRGWETRIGFERKGRPGVLDIEECPIATPVLNSKLTEERKRVQDTILSFTRGATILLRDSLSPPDPLPTSETPFQPSEAEEEKHVAITNHKLNVYEKVGKYLFSFSAGSFFQNNNSILIPLTDYVKEAIFPTDSLGGEGVKVPTHLVDTYCGSGLFGITLSERFERVAGVEISHESIAAAKKNAEMNGLQDKTTWLCGKAEDIFGGLDEKGFEGGKSCVVVDPPRKGCDEPFLSQLLFFKPLTIVYVSCNVHTQARDVGYLIRESERKGEEKGWKYKVESLRGFDLFPQTAHVESVAVLRLVEN